MGNFFVPSGDRVCRHDMQHRIAEQTTVIQETPGLLHFAHGRQAVITLMLALLCMIVPVSGSWTALVAGHSGADYTFTGNYSAGQIVINAAGAYYLTDDLTSSSSDYGIQIQGDTIALDGNGKNLTGTAGVGINVSALVLQPVVTNFSSISGFDYGLYSIGEGLTVSDSAISGNKIGGIYTLGSNATILRNTISDCNVGINAWFADEKYPYHGVQVKISNNTINQSRYGIRSASNNAQILDNRVYNNTYSGITAGGIRCGSNPDPGTCGMGYYTVIARNIIGDGVNGIFSYEPSGRVVDNIVMNQQQYGLFIADSVNISAMNNTLINNTQGIVLRNGRNQNSLVTGNRIINSSDSGIFFSYYSSNISGNATLFDNYLANNVNVNGTASLQNYTWTNPVGPVSGTNVMRGPFIAGNYWSNPEKTGWSDLQEPAKAGYSQVPYEVKSGSGAFDTAPLVRVAETINSSHDDWTILNPAGNISYPRYSNVTYVAEAKPGADLLNVSVNGSMVGPVGTWTFSSITADHTISSYGQPTPGQVHAFFTQNTTWGAVPLTVRFTNQSLGDPTSFFWDFGDGTKSVEKDPVHTYTTPGTYTVTLRASNNQTSGIGTLTGAVTVTSGQVPYPTPTQVPGYITATFSADQTSGSSPLQVSLNDRSTGNPTSWLWDLGDGNSSRSQNVTHIYTAKGLYSIRLTAQNSISSGSIEKSGFIAVR